MQDTDTRYRYKIQIQDTDTRYRYKMQIQNTDRKYTFYKTGALIGAPLILQETYFLQNWCSNRSTNDFVGNMLIQDKDT